MRILSHLSCELVLHLPESPPLKKSPHLFLPPPIVVTISKKLVTPPTVTTGPYLSKESVQGPTGLMKEVRKHPSEGHTQTPPEILHRQKKEQACAQNCLRLSDETLLAVICTPL